MSCIVYYTYLYLFCIIFCIIFAYVRWKIRPKSACIMYYIVYYTYFVLIRILYCRTLSTCTGGSAGPFVLVGNMCKHMYMCMCVSCVHVHVCMPMCRSLLAICTCTCTCTGTGGVPRPVGNMHGFMHGERCGSRSVWSCVCGVTR